MPDESLTVRAQVDIMSGEEITIGYISFLTGNIKRRGDISSSWMFECKCPRCLSITELGSYLSAALCGSCAGTVIPATSSIQCKVWRCVECGQETEEDKVVEIMNCLEEDLQDLLEHECLKYQSLMKKYSPLLHPNNYQLLILKRRLAGSFGGNITLKQLELRISLLEEFMAAFQIVDPGLTK